MIISLEGSPATGKTTTAEFLVSNHSAVRIPEVNLLYPDRPDPEPPGWYCSRQVDRWNMAAREATDLVVLDGDPYQPVWYNWVYPARINSTWSEALDSFEGAIGSLGVPDFYVFLQVDETERCRREFIRGKLRGHDAERIKRKYDKHAGILGPQRAFFSAMNEEFPGYVLFLEAGDLNASASSILNYRANAPQVREILDHMREWLTKHDPDEFA